MARFVSVPTLYKEYIGSTSPYLFFNFLAFDNPACSKIESLFRTPVASKTIKFLGKTFPIPTLSDLSSFGINTYPPTQPFQGFVIPGGSYCTEWKIGSQGYLITQEVIGVSILPTSQLPVMGGKFYVYLNQTSMADALNGSSVTVAFP
ncbi:MAG: hypothetical protein HQL51_15805 [Magnetococcales bacterium]|nr:hypothetical protein [Magnetococcales bacterium]